MTRAITQAEQRSARSLEDLVRLSWTIQADLSGLEIDFRKGYREYVVALRQLISESMRSVQPLLADLGLDWVTWHYKTIHPIEDWESATSWVQVGIPLQGYMKSTGSEKPRSDLIVYQSGASPYIKDFRRSLVEEGEPLSVLLGGVDAENVEIVGSWLSVSSNLAFQIMKLTKGRDAQGPFSAEEVRLCEQTDQKGVERIRMYISKWYSGGRDLDSTRALGLLRDSCRLTLLALSAGIKEVRFPRAVILVPVYVGENLIGGAAFVGTRKIERLLTLLLSTLAVSVLSALRLREEPEREAAIHEMEELTRAREEFVQKVTHSVQNPIDGVQLAVNKAGRLLSELSDQFTGVISEVERLRGSAESIMAAFTERDPERFLKPKLVSFDLFEFLDTVVFTNGTFARECSVDLILKGSLPECKVIGDKDMLTEVFDNIVGNALRFASRRVTLSAVRDPQRSLAVVSVKDDGPGVEEAIKGLLFRPGVRGTSGRGPSHGLGLYLARKHMRRQGGDVRLGAGREGSGAEFLIEIPLAGERKLK